MKLRLLLIVTIIVNYTFSAQTEKGTFKIGTFSNGFFTSDTDKFEGETISKTKNFSLSPNIGYFVINNLVVGLDVTLSRSTTELVLQDIENITAVISFSPTIQYYFTPNKLKPYIKGSVGFGKFWQEIKDLSQNTDPFFLNISSKREDSLFRYSIETGVSYFINEKISIDLGLSYGKNEFNGEVDGNDIGKSSNQRIQALIGFGIYL